MTDDPNIVADAPTITEFDVWLHDFLVEQWGIDDVEAWEDTTTWGTALAAAGFEVVPAGTAERLAAAERDRDEARMERSDAEQELAEDLGVIRLLRRQRDVAESRLSALTEERDAALTRAEESALRSIEARNPGIDMDEVRAALAAAVSPTPTPDSDPPAASNPQELTWSDIKRSALRAAYDEQVEVALDIDPSPTKEALDEVVSISDELGMYDNDPPPTDRCPTCKSDDPAVQRVRGPGQRHCPDPWHDR